jgi:AGZA family xanthine/uracil permease-like MFS transporter
VADTATRAGGLDGYFGITERGSTVRTEVVAGFTTFMTMAYILFVNPAILGILPDREGTMLDPSSVLTVTALAAGILSIAMGAYARYPFALAAGLGLNAVVAFQLVAGNGLSWPEAMGVVVIEGIIILILVLTKFRQAVMEAVPLPLKHSIAVGIGLFIAIIGFVNGGLVTPGGEGGPPLQLGTFGELQGWPVFLFILGLFLIVLLYSRGIKGALLIGILLTTVIAVLINELFLDGAGFGEAARFGQIIDFPGGQDFELVGNFSFGFFAQMGVVAAILAVFTLMLADFFDTMGTVVGLGREAGALDTEGRLPNIGPVFIVDSAGAILGGAMSASSNTTYIESASGISEGARTGLASVVTGVLFLFAIFLSPLAAIIPAQATAPALVVVGFLMIRAVREIPWDDIEIAIPAFLTMVLMPFTYSITNGIGAGFVAYVFIKFARGRSKEVHPLMYVAAGAFVIYFSIFYVRDLLT